MISFLETEALSVLQVYHVVQQQTGKFSESNTQILWHYVSWECSIHFRLASVFIHYGALLGFVVICKQIELLVQWLLFHWITKVSMP